MSDRIDHVAEAQKLVRKTAADPTLDIARAQIHATLALVKQQRIANIIALRNADSDVLVDDEWDDTYSQIREAVGLS